MADASATVPQQEVKQAKRVLITHSKAHLVANPDQPENPTLEVEVLVQPETEQMHELLVRAHSRVETCEASADAKGLTVSTKLSFAPIEKPEETPAPVAKSNDEIVNEGVAPLQPEPTRKKRW